MSVSDPDKGGDTGDYSDDYVRGLEADNARLRAALAKREFDDEDGGLMCSACRGLWPLDGHRDTAWDHCHEHHPDCPDFSANGVVR